MAVDGGDEKLCCVVQMHCAVTGTADDCTLKDDQFELRSLECVHCSMAHCSRRQRYCLQLR